MLRYDMSKAWEHFPLLIEFQVDNGSSRTTRTISPTRACMADSKLVHSSAFPPVRSDAIVGETAHPVAHHSGVLSVEN